MVQVFDWERFTQTDGIGEVQVSLRSLTQKILNKRTIHISSTSENLNPLLMCSYTIVQVPLWPPNIDLAVETDRWEELGAVTRDTKDNKPVLRQKRPSSASWSSQPNHTRCCSNMYKSIIDNVEYLGTKKTVVL